VQRSDGLTGVIGWVLAGSGAVATILSWVFHARVEAAVVEEQTLGVDAGLDRPGVVDRVRTLQAEIADFEGLKLEGQVQALALLTRLGSRHGFLPEVRCTQKKSELTCTLTASGSESQTWQMVASLDALQERSRGSVTVRSCELGTSGAGRVNLSTELSLLIRTPGER
jgi:hypothetical protein